MSENILCCDKASKTAIKSSNILLIVFSHLILIGIWWNLGKIADWITYRLLGLNSSTHLAGSLHFFIKDMPFIFILLTLIVFWMTILRSVLPPDRLRRILVGKNQYIGNILAGLIGSITPFCSCSAVPLFIGMMQARIPLSVTFTYLISSPMINEIAFILLWAIVGWQVALTYYICGFVFALIAGTVIGKLGMEKHVEPWVYAADENTSTCGSSCGDDKATSKKTTWVQRIYTAQNETKEMLKKVGIYIIIGIAIGAFIHGYVPASMLSAIMGDAWWSVPVSVLVALPLYDNAGGIIPVVQVLIHKGAALGTVLGFMMSITAISFPELLILKKVIRLPLMIAFIATVGIGIILIGYFFNWLFSIGLIHVLN